MTTDSDIVCVKTYMYEHKAQLAVEELAAHGIKSFIKRDDCGGWWPGLHPFPGLKIMVNKSDEEQALEILENIE